MRDIRWSYDPRTEELDVWDSNNGHISHFSRCGYEGYEHCAQGRIAEIHETVNGKKKLNSLSASIYGDRPFSGFKLSDEETEKIRNDAKRAVDLHYEPYPVHWQLTF